MLVTRWAASLVRVAGLVAVVFLAGCGGQPKSRVHGKVTYQGRALSLATVIFLASDNTTHLIDLKPDGSYEANGIPRGLVKVSVQQAEGRPAPKSERSPAGRKAVSPEQAKDDEKGRSRMAEAAENPVVPVAGPKLPGTYTDPDKSGLKFELTAPVQEWSVDLK